MGNHKPGRPQHQKSKEPVGEAFTMFRRVEAKQAKDIFDILRELQASNDIPEAVELKKPGDMRVTLLERSRMAKELRGWATGFNSAHAILRINGVLTTRERPIAAHLGKVAALDRRDHTIAGMLLHDQVLANEYDYTQDVLAHLHVPRDRRKFKPHVTFARAPSLPKADRIEVAQVIACVVPDVFHLEPVAVFPQNPSQRRPS